MNRFCEVVLLILSSSWTEYFSDNQRKVTLGLKVEWLCHWPPAEWLKPLSGASSEAWKCVNLHQCNMRLLWENTVEIKVRLEYGVVPMCIMTCSIHRNLNWEYTLWLIHRRHYFLKSPSWLICEIICILLNEPFRWNSLFKESTVFLFISCYNCFRSWHFTSADWQYH